MSITAEEHAPPAGPNMIQLAEILQRSAKLRQRRFEMLPLRGPGSAFTEPAGRKPGDATAPEELSISRTVRLPGVPLKLALGRKRTEVPEASTSAEEVDTEVLMSTHEAPLYHCQRPSLPLLRRLLARIDVALTDLWAR